MPATSKAQQRLMGMAYAYKKGELDAKEASQEVKDLADSMTLKQLKKYAATKHEGLPDRVDDNLQPGDIGGMGPIKFPTATETGSGDVPAGQGDAEEEYKKKRRKMKHLKNFESFVNESSENINETVSFQELVDKYKDNPYGIGASSTKYGDEPGNKYIIFKFKDSFDRNQTKNKLKKMGIKSKDMVNRTRDKAYAHRYEIIVYESKVNEEYIELLSLDEPATELINAFLEWYRDTISNWDDYKEYMNADSYDEAAKNAQMEILAHLSNEMNAIIRDRRFRVSMNLK